MELAIVRNDVVEIVSAVGLPVLTEELHLDASRAPLQLTGKQGVVLDWLDDLQQYAVVTFNEELVAVTAEALRPCSLTPSAAGGFDLVWLQDDESSEAVADIIHRCLHENGYCKLQSISLAAVREETRQAVQTMEGWTRCIPDFEVGYMGLQPEGKTRWMDPSIVDAGLLWSDATLESLAATLQLLSPRLGFLPATDVLRTNAFVRTAFRDTQEQGALQALHQTAVVVDGGALEEFQSFISRRKLCILHCVVGSATISLMKAPLAGDDFSSVELDLKDGQLLVFSHDAFEYQCAVSADSVVVQAWVLRAQRPKEVSLVHRLETHRAEPVPQPRTSNTGESVVVTALSTTVSGDCRSPAQYWSMLIAGTDGVVDLHSVLRWDMETYFDADARRPGTHYTQHMGLCPFSTWTEFDNEFFGIPYEEAAKWDTHQRAALEVAYDTLCHAGFTKETLNGAGITISHGSIASELSGYICGQNLLHLNGKQAEDTVVNAQCVTFSNRLQYMFNITGPSFLIDTACSSSLTAVACAHSTMRAVENGIWDRAATQRMQHGLVLGTIAQLTPGFTIGLCGAGMISHQGRCFTFDQTADGFIRAEGVLGASLKTCTSEDPLSFAVVAGTSCNQDGRSASLTAPHGPSQQECVRQSMKEAGITPEDIRVQELHGTGTALGDPIEVGALRATLMTHNKKVRMNPLVNTSSKSNFGHMEMSAGLGGFTKCVLMGVHGVGAPNVHLRDVNAHLEIEGYPVLFDSEMVDQGRCDVYSGVSSFGFSGCNARGDVWTKAMVGQYKDGALDWTAERFHREAEAFKHMYVEGKKKESAWVGTFILGCPTKDFQDYYLFTSATCWRSGQRMIFDSAAQKYSGLLQIGDTCMEYFYLNAGGFSDCQLHPATQSGRMTDMVIGPGPPRLGHNWAIDCRADPDCPAGTLMKVDFWWDEASSKKCVQWGKATEEEAAMASELNLLPEHSQHGYFICGSWTSWGPVQMAPVRGKPGHHQIKVRVGQSGHEEFYIQRDRDKGQGIYPARKAAIRSSASTVPLRGPDGNGEGKHWLLEGKLGESFVITLQVSDGKIALANRSREGEVRWMSDEAQTYFLAGTWSEASQPMVPIGDGQHEAKVKLRRATEEFQILVDDDPRQALYPELPMSGSGSSMVCGPDNQGRGLTWLLFGSRGAEVQVRLDLQQGKRPKVTWKPASTLELTSDGE